MKMKSMSQYQIIIICQKTTNIIYCAEEGICLTIKQDSVKKKIHICFKSRSHKQNRFRQFWKLCLNLCSCK